MLPAAHRLVDAASYREAARRGRRASSKTLVTHLLSSDPAEGAPTRVGFVVSKAVGNAVVRNRTKRRLRALVSSRLDLLPGGSLVVVRALPAAAAASYDGLGRDLDACLRRLGAGHREVVA